jgi:hypothetical protein
MSDLSQYLEQLGQAGQFNSTGSITLNALKAQKKLDTYQLEGPHHYVLPLVSTAVLSGATVINFKGNFQNLTVDFDGRPFDLEEMALAFSAPNERGATLALCLGAVQLLKPRHVRLASVRGDKLNIMVLNKGGEPHFSQLDYDHPPSSTNTTLEVVLPSAQGMPTQLRPFLAERCGYTPAVASEGRRVHIPSLVHSCGSARFQSPHPGHPAVSVASWVAVKCEHERISGTVWLTNEEKSHLILVRHGVAYPREVKFAKLVGLHGVISCPAFRLDLSQSGVMQDEVYNSVLEDIETTFTARVLPQVLRDFHSMMPRDRAVAERSLRLWSKHCDQSTKERIDRRLERKSAPISRGFASVPKPG